MSLRILLVLLFGAALAVLVGFVILAFEVFWFQLNAILPSSIAIFSMVVSMRTAFIFAAIFLVILNILVFALLYLLLDRIFMRPVRTLTTAMSAFAESRVLTELSRFSLSTKEIRLLVKAFVEFTDSVEEVHKRDMEISRVKSDFISTAAHQFRTPLTGIRWALEALQKESLTEDQKALVDNAVSKSRDLVGIVGTLLDISSIESGKHKYIFAPTDLVEITQQIVSDFAKFAAEKNVTINYEVPNSVLPLVRADRQQVGWVLTNLIENAIRYTPAGGSVRILLAQVPDRVQVLVRDTGIGIASKDRNNIFERFYRAGNAVAKENQGNGLGLYIARTIATDHGGDLNFEANKEGPGTTFTLSLPHA